MATTKMTAVHVELDAEDRKKLLELAYDPSVKHGEPLYDVVATLAFEYDATATNLETGNDNLPN